MVVGGRGHVEQEKGAMREATMKGGGSGESRLAGAKVWMARERFGSGEEEKNQ